MHDRARRDAAARKNAGGPRENKHAPPRLPGLALPSSRFSSKGARGLAIEKKLTEADFARVEPTGQQDRYTITDVEKVIRVRDAAARKSATAAE